MENWLDTVKSPKNQTSNTAVGTQNIYQHDKRLLPPGRPCALNNYWDINLAETYIETQKSDLSYTCWKNVLSLYLSTLQESGQAENEELLPYRSFLHFTLSIESKSVYAFLRLTNYFLTDNTFLTDEKS